MSRDITVTFDDGTSHIYTGAPDDVSPDAVKQRATKEFGKKIKSLDGRKKAEAPATPNKKESDGVGGYVGNYVSGVADASSSVAAAFSKDGDSALTKFGKHAIGSTEVAGNMVGGVVSDLARASGGEYSLLTGSKKPAEWGEKIAQTIQRLTAPRTEAGKAEAETVGAVTKPLGDLFELLPKYLEEKGHTVAANDLRVVFDAVSTEEGVGAGKMINAGIRDVTKKAVEKAADKAMSPAKREVAIKAQSEGLVLPPSQAKPGLLNNIMEGISGKAQTAGHASVKNQTRIQNLVKRALGLKESDELSLAAVDKVREDAGKRGYQALKDIKDPNMRPGEDYFKALDDVEAKHKKGILDKTGDAVTKLVAELKDKKSFTVDDALAGISQLREDADKAFATRDKSLGRANRAVADALENAIVNHLKKTGLPAKMIDDYRNARKTIAQTYSIKKAMNEDGEVDARKLARELKSGKLTGDLKTVGEFGAYFGKAAQTSKQLGSTLHISPLDVAGGALAAATAGVTHGGSLAVAASRPAIRKGILSDTYQKHGARTRSVDEMVNERNAKIERRRKAARTLTSGTILGHVEDEDEDY